MSLRSLHPIGVIYWKEILDLLRDKRTLLGMILLPILLYPLLLVGFSQLLVQQIGRVERQEFLVALSGWEDLPELVEYFQSGETQWRVQREGRRTGPALRRALAEGTIHLLIEVPPDAAQRVGAGKTIPLRVAYNGAAEDSLAAWRHLAPVMERAQRGLVERRLRSLAIDVSVLDPLRVDGTDLSTPTQRGAFHLGRLVCVMLVMMAATGAFYPAVDMASGEKERGTMQTLLVSPARRSEIVLGKYLAVLTICLATALLNLASMGLTFSQFFLFGELARGVPLAFAPTPGSLAVMMLVMVPLAGFFCAVCLGLSAFASTYKEAMLYLSPFLFVAVVGAMAPILPGLQPSAGLHVVPVANAAVLLYRVLQGVAAPAEVAINIGVNSLYAFLALWWTAWIFAREDVLLRGAVEIDWRFWRRPAARRPHPSVVEGIVYVLVSLAVYVLLAKALQGRAPFLSLLVAAQVGGFLLPLLLMVYTGGIDARRALRLRFPGWTNLAVGALSAVAVLVLSQTLMEALVLAYRRMGIDPAPMLREALQRFQEVLAPGQPVMKLALAGLLFAGLAPLCEELAFRGFLLSSLRPAVGKGIAVFITGILFGLLHHVPETPRLYGLAAVGIYFGALVVRSGSLWVGVVAHAVNNGLVVLVYVLSRGAGVERETDGFFTGILRGRPAAAAMVLLALVVASLGLWLLRPLPEGEEKGTDAGGAEAASSSRPIS
jgi:sodium transport system permease protein